MKYYSFIILYTLAICACSKAEESVGWSETFEAASALDDWIVEGPGGAEVIEGKLVLTPRFYPEMKEHMDAGNFKPNNIQSEYQPYLQPLLEEHYSETIDAYFIESEGEKVFRGGHFNIWHKEPVFGDFTISFDFKSLSPSSLHMIMFCALGIEGESIFAPSQPQRVGIAQEIMYGPQEQYRISFFHPQRKTANMRRAPGRNMVADGTDVASIKPDEVSHHKVTRIGSVVRYWVNGEQVLEYEDPNPIKGGHWGFRLMACAKGEYDNIKVTEEGGN